MLRLGVILLSLGVLFALTSLALWGSGRHRHRMLALAAIAAMLGVGLLLIVNG